MSTLLQEDILKRLDALRKQGADAYDPARFFFIESLARRAAGQRDSVRQLLEPKVHSALKAYQTAMALVQHKPEPSPPARIHVSASTSALSQLTQYLVS